MTMCREESKEGYTTPTKFRDRVTHDNKIENKEENKVQEKELKQEDGKEEKKEDAKEQNKEDIMEEKKEDNKEQNNEDSKQQNEDMEVQNDAFRRTGPTRSSLFQKSTGVRLNPLNKSNQNFKL
jgi:hypothetical protein